MHVKRLAWAALAALCAAQASAIDLKCVRIRTPEDVDAISTVPEWRRGTDANCVTVSVCVGTAYFVQTNSFTGTADIFVLSKDLVFGPDGRLELVSGARMLPLSTMTPDWVFRRDGSADGVKKMLFPAASKSGKPKPTRSQILMELETLNRNLDNVRMLDAMTPQISP